MRLPALLTLALIASPALACTDDAGLGDDEAGSETGMSDTGGESDTGGGECVEPPADDAEFGPQEYVDIRNATAAPLWIKGGDCGAALFEVEVDGEPARDSVALFERCTELVAADYCPGMCSTDDGVVPSLRIGPGESLLFPFDGRVWTPHPVAESCQVELVCAPPQSCEVERRVAEGASLTLRVEAYTECNAMGCDCDGATTCELPSLDVYQGIAGTPVTGSATFSYPDGNQPEIVLE